MQITVNIHFQLRVGSVCTPCKMKCKLRGYTVNNIGFTDDNIILIRLKPIDKAGEQCNRVEMCGEHLYLMLIVCSSMAQRWKTSVILCTWAAYI